MPRSFQRSPVALVALLSVLSSPVCLVQVPEVASPPDEAGADAQDDAPVEADGAWTEADGYEAGTEAGPTEEAPACGGGGFDCDGDMTNGCEDTETDAHHCGTCSHDCLGGTCVGGKCQPLLLASGIPRPFGLIVDKDFVYITSDADTGWVWRAPVQGCTSPVNCANILSTAGAKYQDIAMDEEALFFTDRTAGRVLRINKTDTAQCEIAANQNKPVGIALDDSHVYWAARAGGEILRAGKTCGGGAPEVVITGTWRPQILRLDATGLYWTSEAGGLVSWAATDGSSKRAIWAGASPGTYMFGIAMDDTWVYWRDGYPSADQPGETGRLARARKDGSGGFEVLAEQQDDPRYLALDDEYVYWVAGTAVLRRAKRDGAAVELLAQGYPSAHGIAVDTTAIYFCTNFGGELFKLAK